MTTADQAQRAVDAKRDAQRQADAARANRAAAVREKANERQFGNRSTGRESS